MLQTTSKILLVKPTSFGYNEATAASNAFQNKIDCHPQVLRDKALNEFEIFEGLLRNNGIEVYVFEDAALPEKPDAVFPNNWISMHEDGTMILYPMCAPNRRLERSEKLVERLQQTYHVKQVLDLSFYENENRFLEGTGSIVFDHENKKAYACISPRTDEKIFREVCDFLGYEPITFHAFDANGIAVYHTNVMMCIAPQFTVICLESIANEEDRERVIASICQSGHEITDISFAQMNAFAGNMLAIRNRKGKQFLAMSQSAFDSLNASQKTALEKYSTLLPLDVTTIETVEGGSARCMMAEIFLSEKI